MKNQAISLVSRIRRRIRRQDQPVSRGLGRGPQRVWTLAIVIVIALAVAIGGLASLLRTSSAAVPEVAYSEMASWVAAGQVAEISITAGGTELAATLREPRLVDGRLVSGVSSSMPSGALALGDLERWGAAGAEVRVESGPGPWSRYLATGSLLLVLGVITYGAVHHRRGGRRFRTTPSDRRLTLADVGGAREARADLQDVIAFLANPERFRAMGARCPTGILLVGQPGTGKTLLARAAAGEAGVPVIIAAGSDFTEMYVGVGASRVRTLARQARAQAPCIVFIDEFDSIGGRRGRPNRSSEEETTLNQLLVEMDGMAGSEGIVWMAATNREDMLDPAVRRPGRFDRVVEVAMPTAGDRLEILRIHAAKSPLSPDVDLDRLASLTVGYSGAELAKLLNDAAIIAVQENCALITNAHVEQARDRSILGRVRAGVVVGEGERRVIALHEAGHVVVGLVACPEDRFHKVTIEPRGRSMGAAHFAPDADRHLHSRRYLDGVIAKALGGRAAELVFLGPEAITTGAGSDLIHATGVARRMVAEFGMSVEVGLVSADPSAQGGSTSAQLSSRIDDAVRAQIDAQAERAEAIVKRYRPAVEAVANALLEREALSDDEVRAIVAEFGVDVPRSAIARLGAA